MKYKSLTALVLLISQDFLLNISLLPLCLGYFFLQVSLSNVRIAGAASELLPSPDFEQTYW